MYDLIPPFLGNGEGEERKQSISALLLFSHSVVSDTFVTPWTRAHQAPLSIGFSRQEYWSGLPFPSPVDQTGSLALQTDYLLSEPPGMMPHYTHTYIQMSTEKGESIHPHISKGNESNLFSQTSPKPDTGHLVNTHCLNKWFS